MRHTFGRKFFTPNINKVIISFFTNLEHLHTSELKSFVEKEGNEIMTTLTKVDVKALLDTVVAAIDIKNHEIILGADGDTEKCIITFIIKDANYESNDEDINSKDFKPTGQKRVLCLAKA